VKVPLAIAKAFEAYGNRDAVVLFVVQEGEKNINDQKLIEYELFETHDTLSIRRTLTEIGERAVLDDNKKLWIDGSEVAVCYFKAGYGPKDFPG